MNSPPTTKHRRCSDDEFTAYSASALSKPRDVPSSSSTSSASLKNTAKKAHKTESKETTKRKPATSKKRKRVAIHEVKQDADAAAVTVIPSISTADISGQFQSSLRKNMASLELLLKDLPTYIGKIKSEAKRIGLVDGKTDGFWPNRHWPDTPLELADTPTRNHYNFSKEMQRRMALQRRELDPEDLNDAPITGINTERVVVAGDVVVITDGGEPVNPDNPLRQRLMAVMSDTSQPSSSSGTAAAAAASSLPMTPANMGMVFALLGGPFTGVLH